MMQHRFRHLLTRQWPQILFACRGTAAALAALVAATSLHLEYPYWAAMTALIVIQPTRGLLFEKSFYRLIGTAIGSVAGLGLLLYLHTPLTLTLALSVWVAGCVGVGNLLPGLRSYGCMMAACTCAVVAMIGYQNPHLYDVAFARIVCIVVGIVVSTAVTAISFPALSRGNLFGRLRQVSAETVEWIALLLRDGHGNHSVCRERDILIQIAEIESRVDAFAAGSFRLKRQKLQINHHIAMLLSLLAVGRLAAEALARSDRHGDEEAHWRNRLVLHLDVVAEKLTGTTKVKCLDEMQSVVAETKSRSPFLADTLEAIVTSLRLLLASCGSMDDEPNEPHRQGLLRQQDWQDAGRAAVRAGLTIAGAGIVWATSGWAQGPMLVMTMSIMLSIFSSKEDPSAFVGKIFFGAAVGSAAAVYCRLVLLPGVVNLGMVMLIIAPFLLVGIFAMAYRATAIPATDATLFFLFLSQPGVSLAVEPYSFATGAIAMVMGVASAWFAYRYLVPISPAIRIRSLLGAITRDIEALAAASAPAVKKKLQARLEHRVIRTVTLSRQYDPDHLRMVEGALSTLAICRCVQRLQDAQEKGSLGHPSARIVKQALHSISGFAGNPHGVVPFLEEASLSLHTLLTTGQAVHFNDDLAMVDVLKDSAGLIRSQSASWWGPRAATFS